MEKVILKAQVRTGTGKRIAKDLRNEGLVPANVYRQGKDAMNLQLSLKDLIEVLHTKAGENVVITLKVSGKKDTEDKTVLIKEIQREPINDKILHVDFSEISLTEELEVNVPLVSHGEPIGVKSDGGTLEHIMWELHVKCLPTAIPENIALDVSSLKIGDAIYVKNIVVPEGVKVLNDPELIAMIVKPPRAEEVKAEVVEEAATPELIRKKKEEEEAGEEGAPKEAEGGVKEAKKEEKGK